MIREYNMNDSLKNIHLIAKCQEDGAVVKV